MVRRSTGRTCMQSDARHGAELCVADDTPPCEARQCKAGRGVASTQRTSVRVHQDGSFHGWRVEPETVEGRSHGIKWTLDRYASESSQVPNRLESPRESTLGHEPWNTSPRQEEKLQIKDRECIALEHLIKCGGQKRSMTCCEHVGSNLRDLIARTQDIVDNEVVQTKNQRKFERLTKKHTEEFEQGTTQSSNGGTAMAAGRPPPENSQMTLAAVAEMSHSGQV